MTFEEYVADRNGDHAGTAAIQAGTGLGCSLVAAFLVFTVGAFLGASWWSWQHATGLGWLAVVTYMGVATWSAWRRVEPLASLSPLTDAERARRELEDRFADGAGQAATALRRESVAGFADLLVAGPRNLFRAWGSWQQRVALDPALTKRCRGLLEASSADRGAPAGTDPLAALCLVRLGLAQSATGPDGAVRVLATAKGRALT